MPPIREDGDLTEETGLTRQEGANAFLDRWTKDAPDDEELSDQPQGAKVKKPTPEKASETDDDEEELPDLDAEDDEDQNDSEDEDDEQETVAGDNAKVKLTIDGKEVTASVRDLKRLYGQEASLTRKSQEVAEHRKAAEGELARHKTALIKLIDRANERYKPYAGIDFALAAKQLEPEEYTALKNAALAAYTDVKFLTEELDNFTNEQKNAEAASDREKAEAALSYLQDSEKSGIKNWTPDLYKSIGQYAVEQGMDSQTFLSIRDPFIIKMLYQAMRYSQAKKVVLEKKAKAPTKVIKAKKQGRNESGKFVRGEADNAMKALKSTGTRQAAADAFLARWQDGSDD
jgi:hypothetical protein